MMAVTCLPVHQAAQIIAQVLLVLMPLAFVETGGLT